jgi:hypothetical protein
MAPFAGSVRRRVISKVAQEMDGKILFGAELAWALGSLWRALTLIGPVIDKARGPVRKSGKTD